MEDHRALLNLVFGESSENEEEEDSGERQHQYQLEDSPTQYENGFQSRFDHDPIWEPFKEINGLWLCTNFLSSQQQSSLLSAIEKEGWFTEASHNQAMKFGDLPRWATHLSSAIQKAVIMGDCDSELTYSENDRAEKEGSRLPIDLLCRDPLFDQLIVNVYNPGEGICAHVDLMRFEDGIAIVSLESSCVMHFTRVQKTSDCGAGENDSSVEKIPIYLTPGSLALMSGEARYLWKHEINRKPGFQTWKGQEIIQKRRTSITMRKLSDGVGS